MLLESDPQAFLIKAYLSAFPNASIRHISEALSIPKTKVHRCLRGTANGTPFGTANGTAKAAPPKGKPAECGTPFGTANGTANGTLQTPKSGAEKAPSLSTRMRDVFNEFYSQVTGEEFYWSAREMKALKDISTKIVFSLKSKGRCSEAGDVLSAFPQFLMCISDPWIIQHLSPSIISSKYNEIITSYRTRQIAPRNATEEKREHLSQLAQMRKAIEDGLK